jgi:hypothetical protein
MKVSGRFMLRPLHPHKLDVMAKKEIFPLSELNPVSQRDSVPNENLIKDTTQ